MLHPTSAITPPTSNDRFMSVTPAPCADLTHQGDDAGRDQPAARPTLDPRRRPGPTAALAALRLFTPSALVRGVSLTDLGAALTGNAKRQKKKAP